MIGDHDLYGDDILLWSQKGALLRLAQRKMNRGAGQMSPVGAKAGEFDDTGTLALSGRSENTSPRQRSETSRLCSGAIIVA
jgi:hypothetical protein